MKVFPKKETKRDEPTDENFVPKVHWYNRIPFWVKAFLIKYWFMGAEFYFFQVGLGYFFQGESATIGLAAATGLAAGVFNEIFVYPILDVSENHPNQSNVWILFKSKKLYSLFINVLYGLIWAVGALLINAIVKTNFIGMDNTAYGFAEPFCFACYGMVIDAVIITIKNLIVLFYHRVIKKQSKEEWNYVL